MTITLLHLFPRDLGASGDSGNVHTVAYRLRERGIDVSIKTFSGTEDLPESPDVVFMGNGPWAAAVRSLDVLRPHGKKLQEWARQGISFCAVGTGAEILSEKIVSPHGTPTLGLGVFPFTAHRDEARLVGYNTCESALGQIVGFSDVSSVWVRSETASFLGHGTIGPKRMSRDDGVLMGASIATQIGGPLLALNPHIADWIIGKVAARRKLSLAATELPTDSLATKARQVILDNMDQVFTTIAL